MLKNRLQKQRGDTLIEVLFATAVFSLVAVGGLSIMNQGTATAQRALEITLVRNEINAQSEALRLLSSSYIAAYKAEITNYDSETPAGQWKILQDNIISSGNLSFSDLSINNNTCPSAPKNSFIINTKTAKFVAYDPNIFLNSETYSQIKYDDDQLISVNGIWIEAVRSKTVITNDQSNSGYIDFNIGACWDSLGQASPVNIATLVRLYEPR